jgi:transcriptional regulator with XRE-family HTH domain
MSMIALSRLTGISPGAIGDLKRGRHSLPSATNLAKIIDATGVSISDLIVVQKIPENIKRDA